MHGKNRFHPKPARRPPAASGGGGGGGGEAAGTGLLYGIHPVEEALRAGRRAVRAISLAREGSDPQIEPLLALARARGTAVQTVPREFFERRFPGAVHQGVCAETGAYPFVPIDDLADDPVIIILDGIEDTHNFGAIARAAVALGVTGIVIAQQRSAPVSAAALKASAGALEHARLARVPGIPQALMRMKEGGRWLFGLAAEGGMPVKKLNEYRPLGIIVGAEGEGLHRLVKERADGLAAIPMRGPLDSLNAATAAAIALYAATAE